MEKLKRQLAEAEAAVETRKKPPATETGPRVVGDGLVIDEWVNKIKLILFSRLVVHILISFIYLCYLWFQKERREKYLARQQVEAVGSG